MEETFIEKVSNKVDQLTKLTRKVNMDGWNEGHRNVLNSIVNNMILELENERNRLEEAV